MTTFSVIKTQAKQDKTLFIEIVLYQDTTRDICQKTGTFNAVFYASLECGYK